MDCDSQFYRDLEEAWRKWAAQPGHIYVPQVNIEHLAMHHPWGGNARQRRRWRRMWMLAVRRGRGVR